MIDNGNGNENEKGRERKVNLINLVKDKKPVFGLDIVERQVPGLVLLHNLGIVTTIPTERSSVCLT